MPKKLETEKQKLESPSSKKAPATTNGVAEKEAEEKGSYSEQLVKRN